MRNNWNTICSLWSINDQTISINCHPFAWKVPSDCLSCEVCEKELKWNLQLMNHKWSLQAIAFHVKFVKNNWNKIYSLWTINDQTISINCHPFAWKVLSDCLSCEVCEKELKWNLQLMNHKWSLQVIACHVKFVRNN